MDNLIRKSGILQLPVFLLMSKGIPAAFFILGMTFQAPKKQDFWCARTVNISVPEWREMQGLTDEAYKCNIIGDDGNKTKCSEWEFDHSENPSSVTEDFLTVCDKAWMVNFSQMSLMFGMMLGNFIFSHVSDWYGRKIACISATLFILLGGLATALSPNFIVFTILRVITSIGLGGAQNGPFTLAMEYVDPSKRAVIAFAESFGWIVGLMILPIFPYLIRDWRYLQVALSLGCIPLLIFSLFVDESPRWLLAVGHKDRARNVISRILKRNKMPNDSCSVEDIVKASSCDHINEEEKSKGNILQLFSTRRTALTTISFYLQYPMSILVYYNMMYFIVDIGKNPYVNVLFTGIFETPCLILVYLLVRHIRRKLLYFILYIPSIVTCAALYFTTPDMVAVRMALATIAKTGVQLAFAVMGVHVNESYPTKIRGVALGSSVTISRIGAISSPAVENVAILIVASLNSSVCLIALILSLLLSETFNKPLPEEFESDQRVRSDSQELGRSQRQPTKDEESNQKVNYFETDPTAFPVLHTSGT